MPTLDEAVARLALSPVLLVAVDFDGTLAPIVDHPPDARAAPRAVAALVSLSAQTRTHVAVISGRGRADLAARLGSLEGNILLVGSHGSEVTPETTRALSVNELALVRAIRTAVDAAAAGLAGVEAEHKAASSALHYRNASREVAAEALRRLRAARRAPALRRARLGRGKKVVELLAVGVDKGDALAELRARLGASATVFIGDDRTDESAFRRLGPLDAGVKVGPGPTAASYRVRDPAAVAALLVRLAELRRAVR